MYLLIKMQKYTLLVTVLNGRNKKEAISSFLFIFTSIQFI